MTHSTQKPPITENKAQASLSYRSAGVDIEKGNALVNWIKPLAQKTSRPGVLHGIGGFAGLFELPSGYHQPVLVSGTDGVGTKLKLAIDSNQHDTIGIDLVAMCVNDIITTGAEPLFFLDYYATGHLNLEQSQQILNGIAKGCEIAGAALIGGETAEMPGLYEGTDYDLAGFCVGIVEKEKIINSRQLQPGDSLIALASSGPHSNGYSLIRKILAHSQASFSTVFEHSTLGEILLAPTRIYVKAIKELLSRFSLHALAHITGGGLIENIPRVLPPYTQAILHTSSWEWPPIFHWLQKQGRVAQEEMWKTFNLGVGMVLCVNNSDTGQALEVLEALGEKAWCIGEIQSSSKQNPEVVILA